MILGVHTASYYSIKMNVTLQPLKYFFCIYIYSLLVDRCTNSSNTKGIGHTFNSLVHSSGGLQIQIHLLTAHGTAEISSEV